MFGRARRMFRGSDVIGLWLRRVVLEEGQKQRGRVCVFCWAEQNEKQQRQSFFNRSTIGREKRKEITPMLGLAYTDIMCVWMPVHVSRGHRVLASSHRHQPAVIRLMACTRETRAELHTIGIILIFMGAYR